MDGRGHLGHLNDAWFKFGIVEHMLGRRRGRRAVAVAPV